MLWVLIRITLAQFLWVPTTYELPHDKTSNVAVRPAKTQISLGIHPVWSEPLLCAQWVAKDPRFLHADSEDFDQTGQMPRLIWVFAGRTATLLVLSRGGSYVFMENYRKLIFNYHQIPSLSVLQWAHNILKVLLCSSSNIEVSSQILFIFHNKSCIWRISRAYPSFIHLISLFPLNNLKWRVHINISCRQRWTCVIVHHR